MFEVWKAAFWGCFRFKEATKHGLPEGVQNVKTQGLLRTSRRRGQKVWRVHPRRANGEATQAVAHQRSLMFGHCGGLP